MLRTDGAKSRLEKTAESQVGISVQTVLRSLFDVKSEFDVETERMLGEFRVALRGVQQGDADASAKLEDLTRTLAARSEEVRDIVAFERAQLARQLSQRNRSA